MKRKAKPTLGFLVFLVLVVLLSPGLAFQNEPEGFRGLKWGDSPTEDMFCIEVFVFGGRYLRTDDKLEIGGAKLEKISYLFHKGQFMEVEIETRYHSHESLKDVVELKFGLGNLEDKGEYFLSGGSDYEYRWTGDIATIILYINFVREHADLIIYSTEIHDQRLKDLQLADEERVHRKEEEKQKAAEEGLDDF